MILLSSTFSGVFNRDSVSTLNKAETSMNTAIGIAYTVANRIAIVAAVLAVILCGISFVLGQSNKRDMAQNKTILTRVIGAAGLIFMATAVVSWVVGMSI